MAIDSVKGAFFADPAALSGLKREAAAQTPEAVRETARQFESLFTTMMLKSMRSASMGDPMFDSSQGEFYQEMFDQQLAVQLSKGKGLGLSDMLVRQLMQGGGPAAVEAKPASGVVSGKVGDTTAANWPPATREEFVDAIRPAATAAAAELGVDPDTIIAHAALETGWGKHLPTGSDGRPSFNLFGIKAGGNWKGAAADSATNEFADGRMQQVSASFRAYESPADSVQDYVGLLKGNPRYAGALGTGSDAGAFARGLARGGYATDPDYVAKLTAVAAKLKSGNSLPINNTNAI
jgi:peptidoglycan hydrolase FlgJ